MKKIKSSLVAILVVSSLYSQLNPVREVRFNAYNKSIVCYSEDFDTLPEGCAASLRYTFAQKSTIYLILSSSLGLICIGFTTIFKTSRRKK